MGSRSQLGSRKLDWSRPVAQCTMSHSLRSLAGTSLHFHWALPPLRRLPRPPQVLGGQQCGKSGFCGPWGTASLEQASPCEPPQLEDMVHADSHHLCM